MKESTKIRLFAIAAALTIGMIGCAFSQNVKARSYRDVGKSDYDHNEYFNISLVVYSDSMLIETDSIEVVIRERDSLTAVQFFVCEKTDLYFAYDHFYEVFLRRKGYSVAFLEVNAGVKVRKYTQYIPVYLEPKDIKHIIGIVVWDSRINDIHYYPEKIAYK